MISVLRLTRVPILTERSDMIRANRVSFRGRADHTKSQTRSDLLA